MSAFLLGWLPWWVPLIVTWGLILAGYLAAVAFGVPRRWALYGALVAVALSFAGSMYHKAASEGYAAREAAQQRIEEQAKETRREVERIVRERTAQENRERLERWAVPE